jgi:sugar lactone lactonase YvrE
MDEQYHLFVADPLNDRVLHFNPFGRQLAVFGEPAPAAGDAGRDRPGVLDRPHAVAVRGDLVYVACGEQPRRRGVQRFSRQGTVLRPLAARGDADAKFGAPRGIHADADGVLVADTLRGAILRYRGDGTFLRELPCGPAGELSRPVALLRQPGGRCLFVDRGDEPGVRALGLDGAELALPEDVQAHCVDPIGLAADRAGRVFVLDRLGERVLRFSPELRFEQVVIDLEERLDDPPASSPGRS